MFSVIVPAQVTGASRPGSLPADREHPRTSTSGADPRAARVLVRPPPLGPRSSRQRDLHPLARTPQRRGQTGAAKRHAVSWRQLRPHDILQRRHFVQR